jgi:hypothetical protein
VRKGSGRIIRQAVYCGHHARGWQGKGGLLGECKA